MNPFNKDSLMTPAAYIFLIMIVTIPVQTWYPWWDIVSYSLFALTFVVAFLWNELYLWKEDDDEDRSV